MVGTNVDKLPESVDHEELEARLLSEYRNRRDSRIEDCILINNAPTSTPSAFQTIERLQSRLLDVAKTHNMLRMQVPSRWISISQVISDRRLQGLKVLSWNNYLNLAISCGVEDSSKAKDAVKFLHEVGLF